MGCVPFSSVGGEESLQSASLAELLAGLQARTTAIASLKALMTVRPARGPSFTASLEYGRSGEDHQMEYRLRGFDLLGRTLFDGVGSADGLRVVLPGRPEAYEGKEDDPVFPGGAVRISEIRGLIGAALGPFVEPGEIPLLEETGAFYRINLVRVVPTESGPEGRWSKRLWFERRRLRMVREELFREGETSRPSLLVELEEYRPWPNRSGEAVDWPRTIRLDRPGSGPEEGFPLEVEFLEVRFNADLAPGKFQAR